MPSPGVMMPTMRSPGTAPPFGAKRTGNSPVTPRIGIAPSASLPSGTLKISDFALRNPNQPLSGLGAGARVPGDHDRLPCGGRRGLCLRRRDLDLVAIRQFGDERRDLAVDLGTDRAVADVGVHSVSEVDGGCLARQRDQAAFRREAEYL